MEFVVGYIAAWFIAVGENAFGRKPPKNYQELMKTDAYANDKALQSRLNEQPRDENVEVL
jgi:hypothetical protein